RPYLVGDPPRSKIKCVAHRTTQSSARPFSVEVTARIDACAGASFSARHKRIGNAPKTLHPGGAQCSTHPHHSCSRSPFNSWRVCSHHLPVDAHPEFNFEIGGTGKEHCSASV